MRVVAGSARGIPLRAPRAGVRPTMDRVKAAIFSSLAEKIPGARVLDLFAGSGALGIEALSRGCDSAAFVESDRRAVETIRRNLEKTRLEGAVHPMDAFHFLDRRAEPHAFDIIFADPPYAKAPGDRDCAAELLQSPSLPRALAPGGIFVLEKMPGAKLPAAGWECVRLKRYGSTEVAFLRWNPAGSNP
jgi:16S rRNA (guanine966-N2)-methyltransferase